MNVPLHPNIVDTLASAAATSEIAEAGNDVVGVIRIRSSGGNTFWMEPLESAMWAIKSGAGTDESKW
jgi:hypothetical protein